MTEQEKQAVRDLLSLEMAVSKRADGKMTIRENSTETRCLKILGLIDDVSITELLERE